MLMRKLLLLFPVLIFLVTADAQDTPNSSLKRQIDSLEKRLDEGNYVRVPKDDFDKILKNSVADQVSGSIRGWIGFLATLIGLLGFFIATYFKSQINNQVDTALSKKLTDVDARIDKQIQNEKDENARQDKKLSELTERIDKILASQAQFTNESAALIDKKIKDILSFAWDDIAESKLRLAEEKKFNSNELIQELTAFLESKEIAIRKEKRVALIDALMSCYYSTPTKNVGETYNKMIELLRTYEKNYELLPETYANAAIALKNSYDQSGSKVDRHTCIDSCDKSIGRLTDYGEPYAIKLEVFMMDYKKAFDDKERNDAVENIKRVFNAIENNKSKILCTEILNRLAIDAANDSSKEYISDFEKLFWDDLINVRQRVCSDIMSDKKMFYLEKDTTMFYDILEDHLVKSPVIDGDWICNKVITGGKKSETVTDFTNLTINVYDYSLKRTDTTESGFIHLLPYTKNAGINFYKHNPENEFSRETIRCIYKMEKDQLVICFNYSSKERPQEFSSTPENKFILAYFNKAA